jgi:hypothetical protein
MMTLVLQPTIDQWTTEELEQHIEAVRARRMVCAMEYAHSQELKFEAEKDKLHRKLKQHYEMLGKELEKSERAVEACERRVLLIEQLKQEAGIIEDYE